MSGPARAGLFIYAKELESLAHFYQTLLGMSRAHATAELVVLSGSDLQIVVHAMPAQLAAQIGVAAPPVKRDNATCKFFYSVPSLAQAAQTASTLGGELLPERWPGPGFVVCNAVDPEGNIFQLREGTP